MVVFGYSKTLIMVSVEMEVIHTILFLLKNAILLWTRLLKLIQM